MATAPSLTPQQFEQIADLTPQQAASVLLAFHEGDDTKVEKLLWATWSKIAGGDPSKRGENVSSQECRFLVEVLRAVTDGHEDPPVAQNGARRRTMQAWIARSSSASRHIVGAAA